MRIECIGDWFCVGCDPTLDGLQAGYNARLDAAFVTTPAGWRFYLDPCPGGMTRALNQILSGEAAETPPPHLSLYRGGGGSTWFGETFDFPDPATPGGLLGRAANFIKRLRRAERLAGQALKQAAVYPADYGLCRVIVDEIGRISVVIPRDDDGYPVEMPGNDLVHRAAWYAFNCYITRDYDLISGLT